MKIREHRGSLLDSMKTVAIIQPTMEALKEHICKTLGEFLVINKKHLKIQITPYGYDDRIKWDSHIVTIDGYGVYGFTDGPILSPLSP